MLYRWSWSRSMEQPTSSWDSLIIFPRAALGPASPSGRGPSPSWICSVRPFMPCRMSVTPPASQTRTPEGTERLQGRHDERRRGVRADPDPRAAYVHGDRRIWRIARDGVGLALYDHGREAGLARRLALFSQPFVNQARADIPPSPDLSDNGARRVHRRQYLLALVGTPSATTFHARNQGPLSACHAAIHAHKDDLAPQHRRHRPSKQGGPRRRETNRPLQSASNCKTNCKTGWRPPCEQSQNERDRRRATTRRPKIRSKIG